MARYGIPYKGSKSRIAAWIVENLPASHTLVDIFAGGCAVTHAAMESGKWDKIVANDKSDAPQIFVDAINGEFADYSFVPNREEFFASDDDVVKLLYSFGNNRCDYVYGKDIEPVKVAASKMLSAPSLHERRVAYKAFIRELAEYLRNSNSKKSMQQKLLGNDLGKTNGHGLQGLQGVEALERVEGLERVQSLESLKSIDFANLTVTRLDYRDVVIEPGSTVYADPPYANTVNKQYGSPFNHKAFEKWLADVDFPVFVSEYVPPEGTVVVASRNRMCSASATTSTSTTELLCVQERFASEFVR